MVPGHYAEVEQGKRNTTERTIKLISSAYGVNEEYLRTGTGEMFGNSSNYKLERLKQLFKNFPPEYQENIMQYIEHLKLLYEKLKNAPDNENINPGR